MNTDSNTILSESTIGTETRDGISRRDLHGNRESTLLFLGNRLIASVGDRETRHVKEEAHWKLSTLSSHEMKSIPFNPRFSDSFCQYRREATPTGTALAIIGPTEVSETRTWSNQARQQFKL
ncbi:hypothetical protein CDAR_67881 [Caerostris darwini]|uniref:Uncharacterized protein n=1 Tax=Caerostris darwini TaxID=1538125 RepID=A0AAV4VRX4_9ARAC|nr:hypothetical protein CDAR_67881 [Caerostris darwini]